GLGSATRLATSDDDGEFRFDGFASAEPIQVGAWKDGYWTEPDASTRVDATPGVEVTLVLSWLQPVPILALHAATGAPLDRFGLSVGLQCQTAFADRSTIEMVDRSTSPLLGDDAADPSGARLVRLPASMRAIELGVGRDGYEFDQRMVTIPAAAEPPPTL